MKTIKFEENYRDDLVFMVLEAKNSLGRVLGLNQDIFTESIITLNICPTK